MFVSLSWNFFTFDFELIKGMNVGCRSNNNSCNWDDDIKFVGTSICNYRSSNNSYKIVSQIIIKKLQGIQIILSKT